MSNRLFLILAASVLLSAFALAASSISIALPERPTVQQVHECDLLASDEYDYERVAEPVNNPGVDIPAALKACLRARLEFPDQARFTHLLGRVSALSGNVNEAIDLWEEASSQGYAASSFYIGVIYLAGIAGSIERDPKKGAVWLERSAEQGNPAGQYLIGNLYLEGMGGTRDSRLGHYWIKQAAKQNHPNGLLKVGQFYEVGFHESKNIERAIEYYRRAADLGNKRAHYELALLAMRREGMKQDLKVARQYLEMAADGGDQEAMINLGTVLFMGDDAEQSEAKMWFCKAGRKGQGVYRAMQNEDLECD